jgi:hypothetical protein
VTGDTFIEPEPGEQPKAGGEALFAMLSLFGQC